MIEKDLNTFIKRYQARAEQLSNALLDLEYWRENGKEWVPARHYEFDIEVTYLVKTESGETLATMQGGSLVEIFRRTPINLKKSQVFV